MLIATCKLNIGAARALPEVVLDAFKLDALKFDPLTFEKALRVDFVRPHHKL